MEGSWQSNPAENVPHATSTVIQVFASRHRTRDHSQHPISKTREKERKKRNIRQENKKKEREYIQNNQISANKRAETSDVFALFL